MGMSKLLVTSFHLDQAKLKGPVPPGLTAWIVPFCVPDELQKMKTGSFTPGAKGKLVYLTALAPGAESCATEISGESIIIMKKK
jgi:hypothetical protein